MSDHLVAFTPKAGFEHPDGLGSVFVNDGLSLNLRELVAAGYEGTEGVFVLQDGPDAAAIAACDAHYALKRTTVPSPKKKAAGSGSGPGSGSGGSGGNSGGGSSS